MILNVRDEDSSDFLEINELFRKLQDEFSKAERVIKQGELSVQGSGDESSLIVFRGVFFPAVNELRYAGKHMSDFNISRKVDDLLEAVFHCLRARNDAYDSLIQYRLRDVRQFMEDYKLLVIGDVVPDYANYKRQINSIKKRIGRGSEEDSVETLEESLDTREKDYKALEEICEVFDSYRDDLNAKLKKEKNSRFYKLATLVVAVSGLVATLVFKFI